MSTDVKSKTFLNSLSAATASVAALQTTSGADNLNLATASTLTLAADTISVVNYTGAAAAAPF